MLRGILLTVVLFVGMECRASGTVPDTGGDASPLAPQAHDLNESWAAGEGLVGAAAASVFTNEAASALYDGGHFIELAQKAGPLKDAGPVMWYWYYKSVLASANNGIYIMEALSESSSSSCVLSKYESITDARAAVEASFAHAFEVLEIVRDEQALKKAGFSLKTLQTTACKAVCDAVYMRRVWRHMCVRSPALQ